MSLQRRFHGPSLALAVLCGALLCQHVHALAQGACGAAEAGSHPGSFARCLAESVASPAAPRSCRPSMRHILAPTRVFADIGRDDGDADPEDAVEHVRIHVFAVGLWLRPFLCDDALTVPACVVCRFDYLPRMLRMAYLPACPFRLTWTCASTTPWRQPCVWARATHFPAPSPLKHFPITTTPTTPRLKSRRCSSAGRPTSSSDRPQANPTKGAVVTPRCIRSCS